MKSSEEEKAELNPAFVLIGFVIATIINTTIFALVSRDIGWTDTFIPMAVVVFAASIWTSALKALADKIKER